MCGITAVIALDGFSQSALDESYGKETERAVYESLKAIKHRGPDSEDVWVSHDNRVALGMTRLSINDLSEAGQQPFHDETGNIHAIANGEIYTSDEVRAELATWYAFKGRSDCEVIIPLYLKYGMNFLSHLHGEFALVLYDERRKRVIAARDRFGIKPLFHTVAGGRLLISSEAKGFLPLGWKPEWDVRSLLDEGWLHDERTLFKRVYKVRPGHYMTCLSFDLVQQRQYWDMDYPDKNIPDPRSEDTIVTTVRHKIRAAVKERLVADVPVGIYLSGGIDSSAVAGIAVSLLEEECAKTGMDLAEAKKRLKCFSVGFESEHSSFYDETPIAKRTADMLGLEFHAIKMDDQEFAQNFAEATYCMEQNHSDLSYVGKFCLSKLARSHGYKVILTGEGSDEIFAGYSFFYPDFIREPDASRTDETMSEEEREQKTGQLEKTARSLYKILGIARYSGDVGCSDNAMLDTYDPVKTSWRRSVNNVSFADQTMSLTPVELARWAEEFHGKLDARETIVAGPDGRVLELINKKWHPLHTAMYIWARSSLPNFLLTCLGDRMEMGNSVEGRPPFLDHRLVEYVNQLPPSLKMKFDPQTNEFTEKWVLREAVEPYVLEELYKRKKHPFTAPTTIKPGGKMQKVLADLVTRENVEKLGFLDWEKVQARFKKAFDADLNAQEYGSSARYLYTIAQWVVLSQKFGIPKAEPPFRI